MGDTVEIRVDEEVFARLQAKAEPLVDTPNDVLRRLLLEQKRAAKKATAKKATKKTAKKATRRAVVERVPRGSLLPEGDYVQPILQALVAAGGSAQVRSVMDAVRRRLEHRFKAAEYAVTAAGRTRWEARTRDVRVKLVKQGLLAPASRANYGVWEITAEGRRQASGLQ